MSPDTPSIVFARDAVSNPIAENASAPIVETSANVTTPVRIGTSSTHTPNAVINSSSAARNTSRDVTNDARNDDLRIGVTRNRLSTFRCRMSATAKVGGKDVDLPFFDPTLNGPFVAWLCSDDAAWVTGQIFGTGGDRVMIVEQPRYATGMFKPDGWSVEDLAKNMKSVFGTRLEPFGLMKPPYAYYGGVKVEKSE